MNTQRGVLLWALIAPVCVTDASGAAGPEKVKFPCSRDVWVSAVGEEQDHSMGQTPQLKLKSIQEMAILDFDLSALRGRTVDGGWLYFKVVVLEGAHAVAGFNLPFPRNHLLRRIGLSTVSADWEEGRQSQSYQPDKDGGGATFRQASYSRRSWAFPGSDLTDVTMGNGNTLQGHAELEDLPDMWVRVRAPADLVQSLIVRDGFGWCIMDELGQGLVNNMIYSRHSKGNEPYLVVNVIGSDKDSPAPPQVTVRPAPARAHLDKGALAIEIAGADDVFCYFVKINGQDVPRWMIPHPKAGKTTVVADTMKDSEPAAVEVVAADAAGNVSPPARAGGKASAVLAPPPKLPEGWKPKAGDPPVRSGKLRAWAYPEGCKVSPVNGAMFEAAALKTDERAYQRASSVWDGATNTVRVFGARGEIVAFQLALERTAGQEPLKDIVIRLDGLGGPRRIAGDRVRMFRQWSIRWPEYAIPIPAGEKLAIPWEDNGIAGQNVQSVYVDIAIPQDANAGAYAGQVDISAAGVEPFSLPVKLEVYDFSIPDAMRFNPELNVYASPAKPGSEAFFEAYRLAHYNRCTLSITQSGHGDGVKTPLPIEGAGADVKVKDWTEWDRSFGPLLDGSAFKDLPRSGVPLPTCQVPLSHGTPLPVDRYYSYDGQKRGKNTALIHALLCKPIDQAFSRDYQEGWMSCARQTARHCEEKGWDRTVFLFYLDGKSNYRESGGGTSYWLLDEPYNYDDWMALRFWGTLFRKGIEGVPRKARFGFRCDISRPQWTRDWLYGTMTHMYVGGLMAKVKRCQIMAREGPMVLYAYGACNKPTESNLSSVAWCLSTYLAGADGVLPWQSLGNENSLKAEDPLGLIVLNAAGKKAVASLRVMALRRGAQDVEYLITLAEKYGLNREQLGALVAGRIDSAGEQRQGTADDAAPTVFRSLSPDAFAELREGLARLIAARE